MAINWKARAKKREQEALTANEKLVKVAFCLEKEKALHRRVCEKNMTLNGALSRALMSLYAAAENASALRQTGMASTLRMIADDLSQRDTCAMGIAPKDEQH